MSDSPTAGSGAEAAAEKGVSRATAVKMAAAGAAGIAGAALTAPDTASAASNLQYFAQNSTNATLSTAFGCFPDPSFGYDVGIQLLVNRYGVLVSEASVIGVQADVTGTATGVEANADSGDGVVGNSNTGNGVHGTTADSGSVGVWGENTGGGNGVHGATSGGGADGVYGENTGTGDGVHGTTPDVNGYGVYGENAGGGYGVGGSTNSSGRAGVLGTNTNSGHGYGVYGQGATGVGGDGTTQAGAIGVSGTTSSGVGVFGIAGAAGGTAVRALSQVAGTVALDVQGPARFTNAGVATIAGTVATPLASVKISNVTVTAQSFVLATLQQHSGNLSVVAAVPKPNATHPENSSIIIYLSKAVTKSVSVGWFIVN